MTLSAIAASAAETSHFDAIVPSPAGSNAESARARWSHTTFVAFPLPWKTPRHSLAGPRAAQ